ncbi:MAG: hypothetical protein Q7J67_02350 [bacterium]|nr:hypothetical protein [bacterium]
MRKVVRSAVRTICVAGCLMLFLSGSSFAEGETAEALFMKAMQMETRDADYEGAIGVYEKIMRNCEDEETISKTIKRMRDSYEKVGRKDEKESGAVINKMFDVYRSLASYQDTGEVETTMLMGGAGTKQVMKSPFKMFFKRPNLLRFEWKSMMLFAQDNNILWSNGEETYTYWPQFGQYKKDENLQMGMAAATGVSGGSAHKIPSMLLSQNIFATLEPIFLCKGKFDGVECHIIAGDYVMNSEIVLWIGTDDLLLRKVEATMKSHKDILEKARESLKESGSNVKIPDIKIPDFSSVIREVHREIKTNEDIPSTVFSFIPPKGAKLVEKFKY